MSTTTSVAATPPGKRPLSTNATSTEANNNNAIPKITPNGSTQNKRFKTPTSDDNNVTPSSNDSFRAWSNQVNESSDTSTVHTLKCTFGDASKSLPSWIKTSKVGVIKDMLQMRGLPTVGSKPVLLNRLQTDLPSVTLDIDSRECLQRVVNSMLFHFGWDNSHLFECKMPARGDLKEGVMKLWETIPSDLGFAIRFGNVSANPRENSECTRRRFAQLGITWEVIAKIKENPDAPGPHRKLSGAGFDATNKSPSFGFDEGAADGGWFSLEELALEKGDKIEMTYDYGDGNEFVVEVEDMKQNVSILPQVTLDRHKTRVNLVRKGNSKIRKQYNSPY